MVDATRNSHDKLRVGQFRTAAIFRGALIGGIAAGILDLGLYFVGKASGASFLVVQKGSVPRSIPPFMPVANCVLGALVAAAVLTGLVKFFGERAWWLFTMVAAVVFVIFFTLPITTLPGDTRSIAFLELMHIPATLGIVGGIWRFGRG